MQYFWEALNNFTNGQWRGQRTSWVQTPLLGYGDGGGSRGSSTGTWALISFSSIRGPEPLPALCHWPQPSAGTDIHLPRQAGVRADGEGRSSRKRLSLVFAFPHTRIHLSDRCPVPLQFFLISGPSTPPAMRPQTRCLSRPPAPAPSSCHTMPGGFPKLQPGEWGIGEM